MGHRENPHCRVGQGLLIAALAGMFTFVMTNSRSADFAHVSEHMACTLAYGTNTILITTDHFDLGSMAYDVSAFSRPPSVDPLCLVPASVVHGDPTLGDFYDGQGTHYVGIDFDDVTQPATGIG